MKSALEAIKAQINIPLSKEYLNPITSISIVPFRDKKGNIVEVPIKSYSDTEISRKAQTTSLTVIKRETVRAFLQEFSRVLVEEKGEYRNANLEKDVDTYFNTLASVKEANVLRIDKDCLVIKSQNYSVPITIAKDLNIFLYNAVYKGGSTIPEGTEKELSIAMQALKSSNNYKIVLEITKAARDSILKNTRKNSFLNMFVLRDLEVGHSEISSNVTFLLNSFVTNALISSKEEDVQDVLRLLESSAFNKELKSRFGNTILRKKIFEYISNNQVTLIRHFLNGNGKITLSITDMSSTKAIENKLEDTLKAIAKHVITEVAPQLGKKNREIANSIESTLREMIPKYYNEAINLLTEKAKLLVPELPNITGSRSLVQMVKDSLKEELVEQLSSKKTKKKPSTEITKTTSKKNIPKDTLSSNANKNTNKKKPSNKVTSKVVNPKIPQLRDTKGHFTSPTKLQTLMQQMLHDTIKDNMQRPNLHYQSGRFAKSVKVEGITRARDGALTAFLSYMRYPYATFESGGAQGHKGYYPSRLINQSAREIAMKLTKERFTAVTIK